MTKQEFINRYYSKQHLGDGVYVNFDGYSFVLTAQREEGEHFVVLSPAEINELLKYKDSLYKDAATLEQV